MLTYNRTGIIAVSRDLCLHGRYTPMRGRTRREFRRPSPNTSIAADVHIHSGISHCGRSAYNCLALAINRSAPLKRPARRPLGASLLSSFPTLRGSRRLPAPFQQPTSSERLQLLDAWQSLRELSIRSDRPTDRLFRFYDSSKAQQPRWRSTRWTRLRRRCRR